MSPRPLTQSQKSWDGNTVWVITRRARRRLVRHAPSRYAPVSQTLSSVRAKVMWRQRRARLSDLSTNESSTSKVRLRGGHRPRLPVKANHSQLLEIQTAHHLPAHYVDIA